MKRIFIAVAIELSDQFQVLTQQLQHNLRNDEIVWVQSKLQHLTLRFLGETPETNIEPLADMLSSIAYTTSVFELSLDKLGVFGSKYAPEVLWYGFSEFSLFSNLFEALEKELILFGFEKNYGNFVPHITVGRIKKIDNKKRFWSTIEKLKPDFSQSIPVQNLKLIQSKLTNEGPVYKTLFGVELKT
jgi:2'-5' RNA ligase